MLSQRKALVTLFQHWFTTSAEEASEACNVAAYIRAVKKESPSLLSFLVNLPDDNGNTVLHYGVSHCNYSIVSLLLDTGETLWRQSCYLWILLVYDHFLFRFCRCGGRECSEQSWLHSRDAGLSDCSWWTWWDGNRTEVDGVGQRQHSLQSGDTVNANIWIHLSLV